MADTISSTSTSTTSTTSSSEVPAPVHEAIQLLAKAKARQVAKGKAKGKGGGPYGGGDILHNDLNAQGGKGGKGGVQIHVKPPIGRRITLGVQASDTIANVKGQIQAIVGIPVADQRMRYGREVLEDGRTLSSYGFEGLEVIALTYDNTEDQGC